MSYDESKFRSQVSKALVDVKKVLDNTRNPQYPADVPHTYDDKFSLAEYVTNISLAAGLNVLEELGLTPEGLDEMLGWVRSGRSVTIRLAAEERCAFDREVTRKIESKTQHVTEIKTTTGFGAKIKDKVVTKVTEYFWKFTGNYELYAYSGNNPKENVQFQGRKYGLELKTGTKSSPHSEVSVVPSIEVNITWLLKMLDKEKHFDFSIDRTVNSCRTPRRNTGVYSALTFWHSFNSWAGSVYGYFNGRLFPKQSHDYQMSAITASGLFVPVVPLFEALKQKDSAASSSSSSAAASSSTVLVQAHQETSEVVLPVADINQFLREQRRSIGEKFESLRTVFTEGKKLITFAETSICVLALHLQDVYTLFINSIGYIEHMLFTQLVAAIGKQVTPVDFANYMRFHNRKLFRKAFVPQPFCYAVRRPDHYPEGTITIEGQLSDGSLAQPVLTTVSRAANPTAMKFPLNAASNVTFGGDRYLHAYVEQVFGGVSATSLSLLARARQFSSFILVIGTIVNAELFDAKAAIIIQNKDELRIPLLLEQMPTPKEFRDAIDSLSPEMQDFAKAYRSMQLQSSLFGICVIQIKPQLEKLLNLPYDCLTKEIELTQDLLELFIKYQIPSDLVTFDPKVSLVSATPTGKVNAVKAHVKTMQGMIEKQRKGQLTTAAQDRAMRNVNRDIAMPTSSSSSSSSSSSISVSSLLASVQSSVECRSAGPALSLQSSAAPMVPRSPTPSAKPSPAPTPTTPTPGSSDQPAEEATPANVVVGMDEDSDAVDYTQIPVALDAKYAQLDIDNALRPTTVKFGNNWTKRSQTSLLTDPTTSSLGTEQQKTERNKAFDLLDALTRSGCLSIDAAELHIVIAATHCFAQSVMNTVIRDNINPIVKVERSSLIVATTIHDSPAQELIKADQLDRVQTASPNLFDQKKLK